MIEKKISEVQIELGDILGYHNPKWLGRAIQWATTGWHEKPSVLSHCGVFVNMGALENVNIVEALVPQGVTYRKFIDGYENGENCYILKPLNLNDIHRALIANYAYKQINKPYGYFKILGQLIDGTIAKIARVKDVFWFRRIFNSEHFPICSYLVAHAYEEAGLDFGESDNYTNPDEIYDWAEVHPDKYEIIKIIT